MNTIFAITIDCPLELLMNFKSAVVQNSLSILLVTERQLAGHLMLLLFDYFEDSILQVVERFGYLPHMYHLNLMSVNSYEFSGVELHNVPDSIKHNQN